MTAATRTAGILACLLLVAGCGAKTPDYQSIWTSPGATSTTTAESDVVPLSKYLEDNDVAAQAVAPESLPDLKVWIPTPKGWSQRKNAKLPATTLVIGKGDGYPSAVLTAVQLNGEFDAAEVIKHGLAEAEQLPNFHRLNSSTDDFQGFPSGMVQGSHDLNGKRMHSWLRMVVATGSAVLNQRYLVQLTAISLADQAEADAPAVEEVMDGFVVAAK